MMSYFSSNLESCSNEGFSPEAEFKGGQLQFTESTNSTKQLLESPTSPGGDSVFINDVTQNSVDTEHVSVTIPSDVNTKPSDMKAIFTANRTISQKPLLASFDETDGTGVGNENHNFEIDEDTKQTIQSGEDTNVTFYTDLKSEKTDATVNTDLTSEETNICESNYANANGDVVGNDAQTNDIDAGEGDVIEQADVPSQNNTGDVDNNSGELTKQSDKTKSNDSNQIQQDTEDLMARISKDSSDKFVEKNLYVNNNETEIDNAMREKTTTKFWFWLFIFRLFWIFTCLW